MQFFSFPYQKNNCTCHQLWFCFHFRHLQSTAPVELVQELTSTLKTYRPVDMAPSRSWSPGMNAGKEVLVNVNISYFLDWNLWQFQGWAFWSFLVWPRQGPYPSFSDVSLWLLIYFIQKQKYLLSAHFIKIYFKTF